MRRRIAALSLAGIVTLSGCGPSAGELAEIDGAKSRASECESVFAWMGKLGDAAPDWALFNSTFDINQSISAGKYLAKEGAELSDDETLLGLIDDASTTWVAWLDGWARDNGAPLRTREELQESLEPYADKVSDAIDALTEFCDAQIAIAERADN